MEEQDKEFKREEEKIIEKRNNGIKKKIIDWLKDPYNKIFLAIFIFAIAIRLYFFFITKSQPVWWDASDYLTQAKYFAGKLDFNIFFNPRRPFFLALLWGILFRLGFGEISARFTELIFSIFAIPAIYLIGKMMFNKKIALISAFLLSIFWQHLFFSFRLMTEIPAMTFFLFSVYFFWKGYVKKNNKILIWFGVFLGLAFLTRAGTLVMFAIFPLYLLVTERLKFLKNKHLWYSGLIILLIMSSFFVFIYFKQGGNPITPFLGLTAESTEIGASRFGDIMGIKGIFEYTSFFPVYFGKTLLILFLISLSLFLFNLIINLDLIFKNKLGKLNRNFFILVWALVPFIYHTIFMGHMEPRYILMAFPPFFLILSGGILTISDFLKKYYKYLGILIIIVILALGAHYQLNHADELIKIKSTSYLEIKQSGEWMKENSNPEDIIVSSSRFQIAYYSERKTYPFHLGSELGFLRANESDFDKFVQEYKPKYLMISVFENHDEWVFSYPEKHKDIWMPVQVYGKREQPVVIIYKSNY